MMMMRYEDIELLCSEPLLQAIEHNIGRNPADVALDRRVPSSQLVATQVKYLQRARRKLPSLYEARCIIPPRAFEQSSSEECARRKPLRGDRVLDLTCGLGIDSMALARNFREVVAVERDEVLAEVVRRNMARLGIGNVTVITASAEEYVAKCDEHFDWVYVDPDRRSDTGRKLVCMEDCSPNVLSLMPRLREISNRVCIKLSPMFDCDEAFRLLSPAEVEVVSLGGECKEINILTSAVEDRVRTVALGLGEAEFEREAMHAEPSRCSFEEGNWRYLVAPDVALQKGRVAVAAFRDRGAIWSNNGYALFEQLPEGELLGRIYEIESISRYRPKELKRELKGLGVELSKRDTPHSVEAVRKACGLRPGNDVHIALTTICSESWVIRLKSLPLQR